MAGRSGAVTFQGAPLTLAGNELKVGDKAPEVVLLGNDLTPVNISSYKGKTLVIVSVPSLDTPVCDLEVRQFNERAASLGENVVILTVSMDLPFAQKRWCGNAGVERLITLSDHKDAAFGSAYGLLIEELRLLARAVSVVDPTGVIRYVELVKEITHEPDYEACLKAVADCQA